jgi:hypothetical protein
VVRDAIGKETKAPFPANRTAQVFPQSGAQLVFSTKDRESWLQAEGRY